MYSRAIPLFLCAIALSSVAHAASEIPLGDPPRYEQQYAYTASVASDGENFFAVWRDDRGTPTVRGTLITRRGEIRNPFGIIFGAAEIEPHVTWSGTSYLVFWTPSGGAYNINVTRVSRDGDVIGAPRLIASGALVDSGDFNSGVASNGSRVILGYTSVGLGVRALLLDSDANVIANLPLGGYNVEFVPQGDGFAAVWEVSLFGGSTLYASHISADGHTTLTLSVGPGASPKIASDGSELLVVSSEFESRAAPMVYHLSADVSHVTRATALPRDNRFWFPKVFWTGDHYVLVADDRAAGQFVVARIAADDSLLDPTSVASIGAGYTQAASNGREILLTFRTLVGGGAAAPKAVLISSSGAEVWPPKPLALGAANQSGPFFAYGAGITLAMWYEASGLYALRIAPNGEPLDGPGILVTSALTNAKAVFDGSNFVIGYITDSSGSPPFERGTLKVRTLSAGGSLGDEWTIAEQLRSAHYTLAARPEATLVAWTPVDDSRLWAMQISSATRSIIAPAAPISPALTGSNRFAGTPAAAWNGSDYLLAWDERVCSFQFHFWYCEPAGSRAARLSASSLLRDPEPLAFEQRDGVVAVASDGKDWLIGWHSNTRRVFADGTFTAAASIPQLIALDWDGLGYLFATRPPSSDSIRLERIPRSGPIVSTLVATVPAPYTGFAIKATGPVRIVVGGVSIAPEAKYGSTRRAFARFIDLVPRRRSAR